MKVKTMLDYLQKQNPNADMFVVLQHAPDELKIVDVVVVSELQDEESEPLDPVKLDSVIILAGGCA